MLRYRSTVLWCDVQVTKALFIWSRVLGTPYHPRQLYNKHTWREVSPGLHAPELTKRSEVQSQTH